MKKLLSLLMLLCMVCTGVWAQTFSAGKHYTFQNKGNSSYVCYDAAVTSGGNTILAAKNIGSAFLLEGDDTNGYKIRLVENPDLYVFAVGTGNNDSNVGIKTLGTDTGSENKYIWRIEANGTTGGYCITPKTGASTWGTNAWNRRGTISSINTIGMWEGNNTSGTKYMTNDNTWYIQEAIEEGHVYTIKAHFTNNSYADQYLVNNNGTLAPSSTMTGNASYWIAEKTTAATYAANYPWMFKNYATSDKYLNHDSGLSTTGTYFKINTCQENGLTEYKHLWSPYSNGRNIGTWRAGRSPWGFGGQNNAGCVGTGHTNGGEWTTDYAIEEISTAYLIESNLTVGGVTYTSSSAVGSNSNVTRNHYVLTFASSIQSSELTPIEVTGYDANVTIDETNKRIKVTYTFKEGLYTLKTAFSDDSKYGVVSSGTTLKLTTADATPDAFIIIPSGKTNARVGQPTYYIKNTAGTSYLTYSASLGTQTEVLILDKNATGITWNNATPSEGLFMIAPLSGNDNRALAGQPSNNLGYGTRTLPNVYYGQAAKTTWSYSWVIDEVVTPEGDETIIYNPNCQKYVTNTLASTSNVDNAATFIKVDCGASATYSGQEYPKFKLFVERKGWVAKAADNTDMTTKGNTKFGFSALSTNALEFIYVDNDIIPVVCIGYEESSHGQLSWNWHGGASDSNVMGLYGVTDDNCNWAFCKHYTVSYTGLTSPAEGGVTYLCKNYTGESILLPIGLDRDGLIAMHVSGYNGHIESVNEKTRTIAVAYDQNYTETSVLWDGNGDASNTKVPAARIPAMIKAHNGDILAFSDWRYSRDDIGRESNFHLGYQVDIEMRRSRDNGRTWSPAIIAANGDGGNDRTTAGYGDASVVADSESDNVLLMCVNAAGSNRFVRFTSSNNGETWSGPTNIASDIATVAPTSTFFTSGKMIQAKTFKKSDASFKRIYAPLCGGNAGDYVLYSDDFGQNWSRLGEGAAQTGSSDECRLIELPNGDILLESRGDGRFVNVFHYTNKETGEGSWGTQGQKTGTPATACNGDLDLVEAYPMGSNEAKLLLLEVAPRSGSPRSHVKYYYKEVNATPENDTYTNDMFVGGWTAGYEVCAGKSAYSSILNLGNGTEAILYEKAHSESETGSDSNPWGYDIKFEKHDISLITNNAYFGVDPTGEKTIKYTLTDVNGATYEGETTGEMGTAPTFTGCEGMTFNKASWGMEGEKATYTANVVFPFPVGTPTYITGEPSGTLCYWTVNGTTCQTNNTLGATNQTGSQEKWEWIITPSLNNLVFTFTLKNVAADKYITGTSAANTVSVAATGTGYEYKTCMSKKGFAVPNDIVFLSVNSSTDGNKNLILWNKSGSHTGSDLQFHTPADFNALMTALQAAKTCPGTEGTKVGQYSASNATAEQLTLAQNIIDGTAYATAAQFEALTAAISYTLNMPQPGHFYRLKSHKFGTYLNSATVDWNGNSNLLTLVNGKTGNNEKTTIMYLTEDRHLVTYATGMGLCNCIQIKTADSDPYEGNSVLTFTADSKNNIGCYNIKGVGGGYDNYLYGYSDKLARLGTVADECVWELEEVETLPLTVGETKFATFYTPVNVAVPIAITPYVCHLDGENLAMYTCKQTTTVRNSECVVIPAHTAVMINAKYVQTYSLPIVEDESIEEYSNNSFFGDVATKPFAEDYTYYSLQKDSQNASQVGFFIKPSGNFKGFQAFLKTEITAPVQRFNVSFDDNALVTDITNVLGTENITIPAYDLSGRKVDANSHRGLYIMNGKKMIR